MKSVAAPQQSARMDSVQVSAGARFQTWQGARGTEPYQACVSGGAGLRNRKLTSMVPVYRSTTLMRQLFLHARTHARKHEDRGSGFGRTCGLLGPLAFFVP